MRRFLRRWVLMPMIAVAVIAVVGCAILLLIMRIDNSSVTELPKPTGTFAVGRTNLVLTGSYAPDVVTSASDATRKLYVWAWYPASIDAMTRTAPYLPSAWRAAREANSGWVITHLVNRNLANVQAHSFANAPFSSAHPSYPVILLRAGASASISDYTTLAEDLASHGYVVLGIDAPYRSFVVVYPDGQVISRAKQNDPDRYNGDALVALGVKLVNAWTADLSLVLDELETLNTADARGLLAGRLDLKRVGIVGHSLGGATALQFCRDDARCVAGIDVDGAPQGTVVATGLNKPFMFLLSDHSNDSAAGPDGTEKVLADIHSIYARLPASSRSYVTIRGANHYNFSDGAVFKSPPMMRLLSALGILRLDGRRQLAATSYLIQRFCDAHIKGDGMLTSFETSEYPEIEDARKDNTL